MVVTGINVTLCPAAVQAGMSVYAEYLDLTALTWQPVLKPFELDCEWQSSLHPSK